MPLGDDFNVTRDKYMHGLPSRNHYNATRQSVVVLPVNAKRSLKNLDLRLTISLRRDPTRKFDLWIYRESEYKLF